MRIAMLALAAGVSVVGFGVLLSHVQSAAKLLGDANCDQRVDSVDAAFVLQFEAGLLWPNRANPEPALPCPFNADVRGDGHITSINAALILQYSAGLLSHLDRIVTLTPLPPPLQPDTAQLARVEEARRSDDGWFMYCPYDPRRELFAQLDGVHDHWVAIYCANNRRFEESSQLVLYERQNDMLVPLLTLTDAFLSLCGDAFCYPADPHPSVLDVNGDGVLDLSVAQSTGGNCWECSQLRLFNVSNHQAINVPMELPATGLLGGDYDHNGTSAVPWSMQDLDGNGQMELIVTDAAWELHGFCHACSPAGRFVLAWDGEQYGDASGDYQAFFDERVSVLEDRLSDAANDADRASLAISIALAYGRSGRIDTAWSRFSEITSTMSNDCWIDLLPAIEDDLRLSVPPDGSRPTTSVHGSMEVWANQCPFF